MLRYTLLVLLIFFMPGFAVKAQQRLVSITPQVTEKFEFQLYKQGFDSLAPEWPILSNSENLLIIQDGEYILNRKSKLSPFAAMGELNSELTSYRLVTSLRLIKSNTGDGSIGFIFMAQSGGKGGFVFEINQLQQYRLRQITGTGYEYLTGDPKDGGWVKTNFLKPTNIANLLELRTFDKKYDLYLNNNIILSFTEIAYQSGAIGFIIGPGTMGKVDFVYIFTNDKKDQKNSEVSETDGTTSGEADVIALAESIIELKTQLNKVQADNEELKQRIESFKGSEQEQAKLKSNYDIRIASMDKQLLVKQKSFDSLLLINQDLNKYKEMVKGNESGDLIITLSKNLKTEKLKSDELSRQNQALKDSIQVLLKMKTQSSKNGGSQNQTPPPPPPDKNDKVFVLPKEN